MRNELGIRLAPLYGGDGSARQAIASLTRASLDVRDNRFTQIDIINPSQAAFDDYGRDIVDPSTGEIHFGIPNSHLRYRDTKVKGNSGVNIQDANLLKIKVTYGYRLDVPLMDRIVPAVMRKVDPGNSQFYNAGRIPITAVATVRMQSDPWPDGNGQADGSEQSGDEPTPDNGGRASGNLSQSGKFDILDGNNNNNNANALMCPVDTRAGNPIHIVTGNKYQQETDLAPLPGELDLHFARHYNSQGIQPGVLGHGWRHDYDHHLGQLPDGGYHLKQGGQSQHPVCPGRDGGTIHRPAL